MTHGRQPTGTQGDAIRIAITNIATDVGNGDATDLLISIYADVTLSQGVTTRSWEGVTILEVAYHLSGWDQRTRLAIGSVTEEADPIFTITLDEEEATFRTADGACLVAPRTGMKTAIETFTTEVDQLSRAHFGKSLADLHRELDIDHNQPRRLLRFGFRRR